MRRGQLRVLGAEGPSAAPRYELRARTWGAGDDELEIWQMPAPATPHVRSPVRVAGLRGRNLELVVDRVSKQLGYDGVRLRPRREMPFGASAAHALPEHRALTLGLLFRTLAPMRRRDNMVRIIEGIEAMGREEAAYWLGMAMHRDNPRRVLGALRMLLTDPSWRREAGR